MSRKQGYESTTAYLRVEITQAQTSTLYEEFERRGSHVKGGLQMAIRPLHMRCQRGK